MRFTINDLHQNTSVRSALLRLNNANARETSILMEDRFERMIEAARVATFVKPDIAFLLAFDNSDRYDGEHFLWFRARLDNFLYVDRVVVAEGHRRRGLARLLYEDLFVRAQLLGRSTIVCEVNHQPPNPSSDAFHAALGFVEIGRATLRDGMKIVRYLVRGRSAAPFA